ncbi:hypothetical protein RJ640_017641, partial [Escallonia rubra]
MAQRGGTSLARPSPPADRSKRPKPELPDRLSALTDPLLLHILSLLPAVDVVKTGSLSKRWPHLWPSVTSLVFRYDGSQDRKFLAFVNKTLAKSTCSDLKKLTVEVYKPESAADLDRSLNLAISKNVQDLDLNISCFDDYMGYNLPQEIYSCSSLIKLRLHECNIVPNSIISWKLLKDLSVENAHLPGDAICKVSSGCPALETLVLRSCIIMNGIEFDSKSLDKLVITGYDFRSSGDKSFLEISAPSVRSLEITGRWEKKRVRLVNMSSLVSVKLDFVQTTEEFVEDTYDDYKEQREMMFDLLASVRHVKSLTLGSWCIQVLSILEVKGVSLPRSLCKCLTVDTKMRKWELPGIAALLQSLPDAEILVINLQSFFHSYDEFNLGTSFTRHYDFDGENYWTSRLCWVLQLKSVTIPRFWESHCSFTVSLLQVLFKNALALEKVVLNARRFDGIGHSKNSSPYDFE